MRSFSFQAGMLLAFCFIPEAWSQSPRNLEKSYSALSSITPAGEFFFFTLNDDEHGLELWRSDGSTSGTFLIKDIRPDRFSSAPSNLRMLDNLLYFTADDGVHGRELWCSDGSSEGTYLVADLSPGAQSSAIAMMEVEANELIFAIDDEIKGLEIWKSDGTFAGTVVADEMDNTHVEEEIQARSDRHFKKHLRNSHLTVSENSDETEIVLNGRTLFIAADARRGEELWRLDDQHVSLVKDIHPGTGESFIREITCIGDQVYFSAYDGLHGSELWKSDGTPEGTEMIMDILPGRDSSIPRNFTAFNEQIYFSIVAADGIKLWVTDGTRDGTKAVFPATLSNSGQVEITHLDPLDRGGFAIGGEESSSRVYVFPNPFTNIFHVRVDSPFNENIALTLMDGTSRTMYDAQEKTNADIQIDMPLTQGNYLVRIRTRKNFETIRVTTAN